MEMKMLSFLRCGVVIALSLVAGRASAQLDSNAKVILYCSPTVAVCPNMTIAEGGYWPPIYSANPLESVAFDTSFRLPARDSIYCISGFEQAFLIVDTISKCFRHLAFSSNNPSYDWPVPCTQWLGVEEASIYFQISLDSLPYTDSVGIISASGVFDFSSSISSQYSCRCGDETWSGSCLVSEIVRDSLSIEIVTKGYLSVSQPETIDETRSLAIMEQGTEALRS